MDDQFRGLEQQLGDARKKVDVSNVSFSVREIVRMYSDGELIIAPSYQRKYRWSTSVASRFIESLFLGLRRFLLPRMTTLRGKSSMASSASRLSFCSSRKARKFARRSQKKTPPPLDWRSSTNLRNSTTVRTFNSLAQFSCTYRDSLSR